MSDDRKTLKIILAAAAVGLAGYAVIKALSATSSSTPTSSLSSTRSPVSRTELKSTKKRENKDWLNGYLTAFNAKNLEETLDHLHPNCKVYSQEGTELIKDRNDMKKWYVEDFQKLGDRQVTIQEHVSETVDSLTGEFLIRVKLYSPVQRKIIDVEYRIKDGVSTQHTFYGITDHITQPAVDEKNQLFETEAIARKEKISDIRYELELTLKKGSPDYFGNVKISFSYNHVPGQDVWLDFVGKFISSFKVNGKPYNEENIWHNNRLFLPTSLLEKHNVIEISYTNTYDHHGEGLHQFIDPADQQEYLYSNFEPFEAHRMVPCFDQPNLKGTWSLTVNAPPDWTVIANDVVKEKTTDEKAQPPFSKWHFATTPLISSYLLAMVAGPYEHVLDSYDNGRIPLGIYARKSLMKYLDHKEIFEVTKGGFKFFEKFFDYAYPFSKYDQLFCPEFNWGAMENVGCVTITEQYIFRDPPPRATLAKRADTILHEMAHMWFGNLVSPVWWDGLWLNESFATYMAALAVVNATDYGQLGWLTFNNTMKVWAYREDQLITTHPIQGKVNATDQALSNFDGITYGKGAALIKQLLYVVGEDAFQKGMQYYFKRHQWSNTTIKDFLEALEEGSKSGSTPFEAKQWSQSFLETAGLNTVTPHITTDEKGYVKEFIIKQSYPEGHPYLRSQYIEVALASFDEKKDTYVRVDDTIRVKIEPTEETLVTSLKGRKAPQFVFLNHNDHAFLKVFLDPSSRVFATRNLEKFNDSLLRQLVWYALFTESRDGQVKSSLFLELLREKINFEQDPKLIQVLFQRAEGVLHSFVPRPYQQTEAALLFKLTWDKVLSDLKDKELWTIWTEAAIGYGGFSKESTQQLLEYLNKKAGSYDLTQAMRWRIIIRASSWGIIDEDLISREEKKDTSDVGQRHARTARTSLPLQSVKAEAWARYIDPETDKKMSYHLLSADFNGFQWGHQRDLVKDYADKFFSAVVDFSRVRMKHISTSFVHALFPWNPLDNSIVERTEKVLSTTDDQYLSRLLREKLDDLRRAKRCYSLYDL